MSNDDTRPSDDLTDNTVMAVFDDPRSSHQATDELSTAGFSYDRFEGDSGQKELASQQASGIIGALFAALGDEDRVLDRLKRHLSEGRSVVVVDTSATDPTRAVEILDAQGGHDMWEFDDWTYRRVATDSDEDQGGDEPNEQE